MREPTTPDPASAEALGRAAHLLDDFAALADKGAGRGELVVWLALALDAHVTTLTEQQDRLQGVIDGVRDTLQRACMYDEPDRIVRSVRALYEQQVQTQIKLQALEAEAIALAQAAEARIRELEAANEER